MELSRENKAKKHGWIICEWEPEPEDKCECCGKTFIQMWYLEDGYENEGTYWCLDCIVEAFDETQRTNKEIMKLEEEGHHPHCACRMVFGDGECECKLIKNGYDPYSWMSRIDRHNSEREEKKWKN